MFRAYYLYSIMNFLFSLLLLGSFYASFTIFAKRIFKEEERKCDSWTTSRYFDTSYLALLFIITLVSITKPIEKSKFIFSFVTLLFGALSTLAFVGAIYFFVTETDNVVFLLILGVASIGHYIIPLILNI